MQRSALIKLKEDLLVDHSSLGAVLYFALKPAWNVSKSPFLFEIAINQ